MERRQFSSRLSNPGGVSPFAYAIPIIAFFIAIAATLVVFTQRAQGLIPPQQRAAGILDQFLQSLSTFLGALHDCLLGWTTTPALPACGANHWAAINYVGDALKFGGAAALVVCAVPIAIIYGLSRAPKLRIPPKPDKKRAFSLFLGRSTGTLTQLGHGAGIAPKQDVILDGPDAAQGIFVTGGIGSGKTSSELNHLLEQSLQQDCGILFFNVKGNADDTLHAYAKQYGKTPTTIGIGGVKMDLLRDLSPEIAASFLQSALMLIGMGRGTGAVYLNVAVEFAKNLLGILHADPASYNLGTLAECVFNNQAGQQHIERIKKIADADPEKKARFAPYYEYIAVIFPDYEQRMQDSVTQSLSQILDAFRFPEMKRAFCDTSADSESMRGLLEGTIFNLDLPLSIYGTSGRTVYTMVQLRFYNLMLRRLVEPTWNQSRYVVMFCDEFQEIIAVAPRPALSAASFFDKSREAKVVGIVAMQGWSSAIDAIGDRVRTKATLQNFRQKICFSTEDDETIDFFTKIVGKGEVSREIGSRSTSRKGIVDAMNVTRSKQTRTGLEDIVTAQLFRTSVGRGRGLCLLQIAGESYDDVLLTPYSEPMATGSTPPPPRPHEPGGRIVPV